MGRETILPHVRWSVGNGGSIRIREDRWLPKGILGGPATIEEPKLVADLIDHIHNNWNTSLLHSFLDEQVIVEILTIPVRPRYTEDKLIWTATKDGRHSVKSSYHILTNIAESQSIVISSGSKNSMANNLGNENST